MSLVALFVCLAIIKFAHTQTSYDMAHCWPKSLFSALVNLHISNPWILIALLLIPPLLITKLILVALLAVGGFFSLIAFILTGILFWFCFGAYPVTAHSQPVASKTFFTTINSQLFALLFWGTLLGPIGALWYRGTYDLTRLAQTDDHPLASANTQLQQLLQLLDYVPVRLMVLLCALAGNFGKSFGFCLTHLTSKPSNNASVLSQGILLAADLDKELEQTDLSNDDQTSAARIIERAVILAIIILLIFILGGLIWS